MHHIYILIGNSHIIQEFGNVSKLSNELSDGIVNPANFNSEENLASFFIN